MPFADVLIDWHQREGRHDLPWQRSNSPYTTWLSEVMLQQTQVTTVIDYYERFIAQFADVVSLANAPVDEVLALWSGLGYYSRARNLHKAAQMVRDQFNGEFPSDQQALESLPGVGRSTAAAIRSLAFGQSATILDGNVKRVLCRLHGERDWHGTTVMTKRLWAIAESLTPAKQCHVYTQAIMDFGATLCTRANPKCNHCPFASTCVTNELGLQKAIPASKPKKVKPKRITYWFMLQDDLGQWLVERRPSKGVWADLHTPYQYQSLSELYSERQVDEDETDQLAPFIHHFSHYSLEIHPVRYLKSVSNYLDNVGEHAVWYKTGQSRLGVPSAFTKLIDEESAPR